MAGYLDAYGVDDERRIRLVKKILAISGAVIVLAIAAYLFFKNRSEKLVIEHFITQLNEGHYKEAYQTWGCSDAHPCPQYRFEKFMEDWGPKQNKSPWQITNVDGCMTGVIVTVDAKGVDSDPIWVERSNKSISFSPWPECQEKRWRFRQFFHSFFGEPPQPPSPPTVR